jgi:hypothetical protein
MSSPVELIIGSIVPGQIGTVPASSSTTVSIPAAYLLGQKPQPSYLRDFQVVYVDECWNGIVSCTVAHRR